MVSSCELISAILKSDDSISLGMVKSSKTAKFGSLSALRVVTDEVLRPADGADVKQGQEQGQAIILVVTSS